MRTSIVIIISFVLCTCSKKSDDTAVDHVDATGAAADTVATAEIPYESLFVLDTYLVEETVDPAEVQSVFTGCAVIVVPSDEQTEEMIKEYGEDDFFTMADDAGYYQSMAMELLDSLKVATVSAEKPYIRLLGSGDTWTLNFRRKGLPGWNIVFFHQEKVPEVVPAIEVTAERIKEYFEMDDL